MLNIAQFFADKTLAKEPSERSCVIEGQTVPYVLERGKRRSIGLFIDGQGLRIRAPMRVSIKEVEAVIALRADWIIENITKWSQLAEAVIDDFSPKGSFLLRGKRLNLRVDRSFFASFMQTEQEWHIAFAPNAVVDQQSIGAVVTRALRAEAEKQLCSRTRDLALQLGLKLASVKTGDPRTQWGSCSGSGKIRLSWRLIQLPDALSDYVIAHEVCHLVELNHSARFWQLVQQLDPKYKQHRRAMGRYAPLLTGERYV
jgi:predicted metal-dependent hydrolase